MNRSTMPACKERCRPVKSAKMAAKGAPTTAEDAVEVEEEELPSEDGEERKYARAKASLTLLLIRKSRGERERRGKQSSSDRLWIHW